jgi:CHASE3 domain sensor protein
MKIMSLLNQKVELAFGAAIAILLIVGAFSYRGMVLSAESDEWVQHTHAVLENLQALLFAEASIESSNRGFVLTGDESFLASYRASVLDAEQREATVRDLTADNADQQRRVPAIEALIAQKIQFADAVNDQRQADGFAAAAEVIQSGKGQQITDEFQAAVHQFEDEELRLLAQRNADAEQLLAQTKIVVILGGILGLLITAAAAWRVQRDSSGRRAVEESLRESEEKYRMLLDGVQDYAIFMLDPQGQVVT